MTIDFNNCLVLEVRIGMTKNGADFAVLRFLDQSDLKVYEVFCFGDAMALAEGLTKGDIVRLLFDCEPMSGGNAGIRFVLTGVGAPC